MVLPGQCVDDSPVQEHASLTVAGLNDAIAEQDQHVVRTEFQFRRQVCRFLEDTQQQTV